MKQDFQNLIHRLKRTKRLLKIISKIRDSRIISTSILLEHILKPYLVEPFEASKKGSLQSFDKLVSLKKKFLNRLSKKSIKNITSISSFLDFQPTQLKPSLMLEKKKQRTILSRVKQKKISLNTGKSFTISKIGTAHWKNFEPKCLKP